jgi:hypothetical protein
MYLSGRVKKSSHGTVLTNEEGPGRANCLWRGEQAFKLDSNRVRHI